MKASELAQRLKEWAWGIASQILTSVPSLPVVAD